MTSSSSPTILSLRVGPLFVTTSSSTPMSETLLTTSLTRFKPERRLCVARSTAATSMLLWIRSFSVYVPGWSATRNTPAHVTSSTPGGGVPLRNLVELINVISLLPRSTASLYAGKKKRALPSHVNGPDAAPLTIPWQPAVELLAATCVTAAAEALAAPPDALELAGEPLSDAFAHAPSKTRAQRQTGRGGPVERRLIIRFELRPWTGR